jgi:hypothetical protein
MKRLSKFEIAMLAEKKGMALMCNLGIQNARRCALEMYHVLKREEARRKAKDIAEGLIKPKKRRKKT